MDVLETGRLMRAQDNRGTQFPLFVVQELHEVVKASGCGDRTIYVNGEDEISSEEYERREAQSDAEEAVTNEDDEEIEWDSFDWREVEISDEWVISDKAGVFLTEHACEIHIAQNSYHYKKPRSYVISAWRNYEMQDVMLTILKLTGEDIPDWYK